MSFILLKQNKIGRLRLLKIVWKKKNVYQILKNVQGEQEQVSPEEIKETERQLSETNKLIISVSTNCEQLCAFHNAHK